MYIKFSRIRPVKSPERANWGDALDFFVPDDFEEKRVFPEENIVIPSGIKMEVPFGYGLVLMNKSGIASKRELLVGACLVDTGYSGEIHIDLHNVGKSPVLITPGMKVVQGVLLPISVPTVMEVHEDQLYKDIVNVSGRGTGGLGSTGV